MFLKILIFTSFIIQLYFNSIVKAQDLEKWKVDGVMACSNLNQNYLLDHIPQKKFFIFFKNKNQLPKFLHTQYKLFETDELSSSKTHFAIIDLDNDNKLNSFGRRGNDKTGYTHGINLTYGTVLEDELTIGIMASTRLNAQPVYRYELISGELYATTNSNVKLYKAYNINGIEYERVNPENGSGPHYIAGDGTILTDYEMWKLQVENNLLNIQEQKYLKDDDGIRRELKTQKLFKADDNSDQYVAEENLISLFLNNQNQPSIYQWTIEAGLVQVNTQDFHPNLATGIQDKFHESRNFVRYNYLPNPTLKNKLHVFASSAFGMRTSLISTTHCDLEVKSHLIGQVSTIERMNAAGAKGSIDLLWKFDKKSNYNLGLRLGHETKVNIKGQFDKTSALGASLNLKNVTLFYLVRFPDGSAAIVNSPLPSDTDPIQKIGLSVGIH